MGKSRGRNSGNSESFNGLNVSQYWPSESVKKDTTMFNFEYPIGMAIPSGDSLVTEAVAIRLDVQPAFGISTSVDSPAFQSARVLYDRIVRMNNNVPPYDPVDIEADLICFSSLYSWYLCAQRIVRLANSYDPLNKGLPDSLLAGLGFDPYSVRKRVLEIRGYLNTFANRMTSLSFPSDVNLFARAEELYKGIYADENSNHAQYYMYNPVCFYILDETNSNGTTLQPIPYWFDAGPDGAFTSQYGTNASAKPKWELSTAIRTNEFIDRFLEMGNDMLNALLGSSDITRICADIRRSYSTMVTLETLAEDVPVGRWHNYSMLAQIENARILPPSVQAVEGSGGIPIKKIGPWYPVISQAPGINQGFLTFEYSTLPRELYNYDALFGTSQNAIASLKDVAAAIRSIYAGNKLLNLHGSEAPTPDVIMLITRLIPTVRATAPTNTGGDAIQSVALEVEGCGTEFIVGATPIMYNTTAYGLPALAFEYFNLFNYNQFDPNSEVGLQAASSQFLGDQFNYCPERIVSGIGGVNAGAWASGSRVYNRHYDMDNLGSANNESLNLLHYTALMGQFKAPGFEYNSSSSGKLGN